MHSRWQWAAKPALEALNRPCVDAELGYAEGHQPG